MSKERLEESMKSNVRKKHIGLTGTKPDISKDHVCKSQLLIPGNNADVAPVLLVLKIGFIFWLFEFRIFFYSVAASCGGRVTSQLPSCIKNIQNIWNVREARTHFIPFCLIWNNWIVLKGDLLIILARCHSCPLHIQWPSVQSARHKGLKKSKS